MVPLLSREQQPWLRDTVPEKSRRWSRSGDIKWSETLNSDRTRKRGSGRTNSAQLIWLWPMPWPSKHPTLPKGSPPPLCPRPLRRRLTNMPLPLRMAPPNHTVRLRARPNTSNRQQRRRVASPLDPRAVRLLTLGSNSARTAETNVPRRPSSAAVAAAPGARRTWWTIPSRWVIRREGVWELYICVMCSVLYYYSKYRDESWISVAYVSYSNANVSVQAAPLTSPWQLFFILETCQPTSAPFETTN